jgi:1-acyl-sn-glycerol-3-phosphate acyltransferase
MSSDSQRRDPTHTHVFAPARLGNSRPSTDSAGREGPPVVPSRLLLRFFDTYLHYFVRRHFHALRLAGAHHWQHAQRPLIVCLNHPSWWDPLISIQLSRVFAPGLNHYAPMDALAFTRYGILRKLGLFPVEQGTRRGAAQFLHGAAHILSDPNSVLWLTPQGSFTDARTRPIAFRGGLDALLHRIPQVTVLPLALEYTFWDERLPEALALLGAPLRFPRDRTRLGSAGEQVAAALAQTQDELAQLSAQRNPALFTSVLAGAAGTSGIYGAWQRASARLHGRRFAADHASLQSNTNQPHQPSPSNRSSNV